MPLPKDPKKAEETRRRMSESAKKRFANPEQRKATSETTKAAMARPEVKAKMHEVVQQQWDNPETRATLIESYHKRWERSEEHQKVSEATKAAMQREDVKERYWQGMERENILGRLRSPETQEKRTQGIREAHQRPEYQRRWKEAMDKLRATDEYREAVAVGIAANKKFSSTNIEIIVETLLKSLEIEYEAQKQIGWWIVDFYIPSKNLVIECDGDYWHNKPDVQARDARKNAYLTRKGYHILRLLGSHILTGNLSDLEAVLTVA